MKLQEVQDYFKGNPIVECVALDDSIRQIETSSICGNGYNTFFAKGLDDNNDHVMVYSARQKSFAKIISNFNQK